jgi:hypothetical protein
LKPKPSVFFLSLFLSNKQPLEGLILRIFDPPKVDDKRKYIKSKGGCGYRQYTEQIGNKEHRLKID